MRRRRWMLLVLPVAAGVVIASAATHLVAEQRFSVPELSEDYVPPDVPSPAPRSRTMQYVDVAVLAAFLVVASAAALRFRSRGGLVVLTLLALGYFGFYRRGCVCPIGAIQRVCPVFDVRALVTPDAAAAEAHGLSAERIAEAWRARAGDFAAAETSGRGRDFVLSLWVGPDSKRTLGRIGRERIAPPGDAPPVPLGELVRTEMRPVLRFAHGVPWVIVAFFALPLVATLLFGRTFCAAVCPLGAIQEAVALKPVQLPAWLGHGLGLFAYVYLAAAVLLATTGGGFLICRQDPFVGIFRLSGPVIMLLIGAGVLVLGVFLARPYCRFLCPYGAILRPLSRLSWRHATITPDACIRCRLCESACPYGAIRAPNTGGRPAPRRRGKLTLAALLLVVPVLTAAGAWGGAWLAGRVARMHPTVARAEAVHRELAAHGAVRGDSDVTEAFAGSDVPVDMLLAHGRAVRRSFAWATPVASGFIALVVALKLVSLAVRRRREDYAPDRALCLSCGRCYASCPVDHARRLERKGARPPAELHATD
ncbi:MAG: 4Fe-4S binding protein [Phycisphaerae bacterium]|nr:4Fe-4S binding protein [Phycisphaerae bacterium]